jgi:hypothetical protein
MLWIAVRADAWRATLRIGAPGRPTSLRDRFAPKLNPSGAGPGVDHRSRHGSSRVHPLTAVYPVQRHLALPPTVVGTKWLELTVESGCTFKARYGSLV